MYNALSLAHVVTKVLGALEMHLLLFVPVDHSKIFTGEVTSGHTEIKSEIGHRGTDLGLF